MWLQRQPQKYEPNVNWCLHESAVTLHSEQKPANWVKKEGEQITRVFLTSLLCTLSPTATSCLPAFLTDFCPKFSCFPSSAHSCPDNLPRSHLLSFGNKCGLSSSCSKQSFQSFYYSFFLENFISFSSLFSFFYFLNNSKNICPESGTDHTMCIVFLCFS